MRMLVLCETLALVFVVLNYILKCLEYKDLRDLFDNRGKSIQMLNEEVNTQKIKYAGAREDSRIYRQNVEYYKSQYYLALAIRDEIEQEYATLKHMVYVLRKDVKRKDRAIVRYKTQNEVFKHGYHESEKRNEDLRDKLLTEQNVANWYKNWYTVMEKERSAYLYCLRQIQEEVNNAKKE